MKNNQQLLKHLFKPIIISFLVSFFMLSVQAQNIAANFNNSKGNANYGTLYNTSLGVYPNPAADEAKLLFYSSGYDTPYQLRIVNNAGMQLENRQGTTIQGQNTIRIHVGNYAPGTYYIQLITSTGRQTVKLLKQPLNGF